MLSRWYSRGPLVLVTALASFQGEASPARPSLGTAASFAVLGHSFVRSSGLTVVSGNVGISPGRERDGFPPGVVRLGKVVDEGMSKEAQRDAAVAYEALASLPCDALPSAGAVPPGVYCVSAPIAGVMTLDGAGSDTAWVFRAEGPLVVDAETAVAVTDGGDHGAVYWQAAGPVSLGAGSVVAGNILARGDITFGRGASLSGRALSLGGGVTLEENNVSLCCPPIALSGLSDGIVNTPYAQSIAASGGVAPYTFRLIEGSLPPGIPAAPGHYAFTIMGTDALGCQGTRSYLVRIRPAIPAGAEVPMLSGTGLFALLLLTAGAALFAMRRIG